MKSNGEMYGVLQKGIHEFFIKEPNKELYRTNIAQFTHLWLKKGGQWELKRVLSFDHIEPPEYFKNVELDKKFNARSPMTVFDKDGYIKAILVKHKIPVLSIGVISEGRVQQLRTFGNPKLGSTPSYKKIHKVASLTKPVAAMVALKVADKGLIALDEAVATYFMDKDIAEDPRSKKITFRHLLSHQSGLPNWRHLTDKKKLSIAFEPGSKYQYSGEGFELMRKAIEAKLNRPFEEIAEEYLFNPLGMTNTAFYWKDNINDNQYAQEHDEQGNPIAFEKYYSSNAAANLLTSIGDYGEFMVHVLDDSSLSKELYEDMLTSQVVVSENKSFGLGWQLHTNLDKQYGLGSYVIQHTGGDFGTKTLAIMFPETKNGLVVFANSENGMVVWEKILTEYYGKAGEEIVKRNLL